MVTRPLVFAASRTRSWAATNKAGFSAADNFFNLLALRDISQFPSLSTEWLMRNFALWVIKDETLEFEQGLLPISG